MARDPEPASNRIPVAAPECPIRKVSALTTQSAPLTIASGAVRLLDRSCSTRREPQRQVSSFVFVVIVYFDPSQVAVWTMCQPRSGVEP